MKGTARMNVPSAANAFEERTVQAESGRSRLVEESRWKELPGRPPLPLRIRFVPTTLVFWIKGNGAKGTRKEGSLNC